MNTRLLANICAPVIVGSGDFSFLIAGPDSMSFGVVAPFARIRAIVVISRETNGHHEKNAIESFPIANSNILIVAPSNVTSNISNLCTETRRNLASKNGSQQKMERLEDHS